MKGLLVFLGAALLAGAVLAITPPPAKSYTYVETLLTMGEIVSRSATTMRRSLSG